MACLDHSILLRGKPSGGPYASLEPYEMLSVGDTAPNFSAKTDGEGSVTLSDFRGKKVVLYFYPRDSTPGCTIEACAFRDAELDFKAKNTVILGVSADSTKSHDRFKSKHSLPFPLISDPDHSISESYGAWRQKKLFGRTYMGIVRSTFVIDEQGKIEAAYDKVKVRGHVADVLGRLGAD